jgi:hypothetical protein
MGGKQGVDGDGLKKRGRNRRRADGMKGQMERNMEGI